LQFLLSELPHRNIRQRPKSKIAYTIYRKITNDKRSGVAAFARWHVEHLRQLISKWLFGCPLGVPEQGNRHCIASMSGTVVLFLPDGLIARPVVRLGLQISQPL
jgi:hypothetical protein